MTDQQPRLVLGFRRRSLADLGGYDMHAKRAGGDRRHIDPERTHLNRSLLDGRKIGEAREAATDLVVEMAADNLGARIAGLKKRRRKAELKALKALADARGPMAAAGEPWDPKNEKPFFDGILSASPSFFAAPEPAFANPIEPGQRLTFEDACRGRGWDPEKVERWVETARAWLVETFADDLVDVRLDLDEQTPHIHFLGAPKIVDGKGRRMLSQRQHRVLGERKSEEDERESYERVLDDAADHFAPLGIVRGERRAALSRAQVEASGELTVEALSPAESRRRAAELLGAAALEGGEILAKAEADGEMIRREAEERAATDVAFAAHRAEVLLGATGLVVEGHVRAKEGEGKRLYADRSEPVADSSRRFAPVKHDDADPPKGFFAAIRGAGVWVQIHGLAERMRTILKREKAVQDREADLAERERRIMADREKIAADLRAAANDRAAAAEERSDAAFERAQATRMLEKAAAAGDRTAAAELARAKMRARAQREL